jgi:hypothetical protein
VSGPRGEHGTKPISFGAHMWSYERQRDKGTFFGVAGQRAPTLVNWEGDLKEQIDNLRAMELEAMYDKYHLSTRKKVEFFGDILSRIQRELETRELSEIPTEKLFAMYAHFYREAQHALPELTFRNDDEVKVAKAMRLPSSLETELAEDRSYRP